MVIQSVQISFHNGLVFIRTKMMKKLLTIFTFVLLSISMTACVEASNTGVDANTQEIIESAEKGDTVAQYNLGVLYMNGDGVPQDYEKATQWLTLAAEKNDVEAQYNLGFIYGEYLKNIKKSIYWYEKAVAQNLPHAQNDLANLYRYGKIDDKVDYQRAILLYKKAVDQGYAPAQVNLANMYLNGYGLEVDLKKAFKLYELAALQDYPSGQYFLGGAYAEGVGVEKNEELAFHWFKLAAEQGVVSAQFNLARRYENGIATEKNLDLAKYWYEQATQQGDEKSIAKLDCFSQCQ